MYAVFGQKYDKKRNTSSFFYNEMRFCVKNSLIEIINVILYKLKTEYQWKYFPMKNYSAPGPDILCCISIL